MARYYSHLIILPDESHLEDFIVELNGNQFSYYPFVGEIHSTTYIEKPILLSYRSDLEGKTVALSQLTWALRDTTSTDATIYAYALTPCPSCAGERFTAKRL